MVDWETTLKVAFAGVASVFLALGILNLTIYFSNRFFTRHEKSLK